ncbi:hypothetical protein SAMN05444266_10617 [Chitinophaga jiangningensis]|uniref:Uncharacterized protein n=1 Tax=Chitinophaga jiangningensis TaxID=1419482 RepID=A0A1M7F722_9BACT|nr:hypothetical protein [Chitinophaga jiangningensis]SHL99775.1 hypothetical protein SAMN05444266_10617 [Chitinophaga jiangningensis]
MTPKHAIPYEMHITIAPLSQERLNDFVSHCFEADAKPIVIELSRGEHLQQPMLTKTYSLDSSKIAISTAFELASHLQSGGYTPTRIKIEIPDYCAEQYPDLVPDHTPYFEWHGKVLYNKIPQLLRLCQLHQVHLSANALKDSGGIRFITLREFGDINLFHTRIHQLIQDLADHSREVLKQQAEYCIYDNNISLDSGWLA